MRAGISNGAGSGDNSRHALFHRDIALYRPLADLWTPGSRLLLATALLLIAACSSLEHASSSKKLQLQLQSYDHAVRWGDLEEMYAFVKPGDKPLAVPRGLENIRVTDYEPLTTITEEPDKRIRRRVRIEYLHRDRQVVKKLVDDQVWEFDEASKQWFRTNPPPEFR